MTPDQQGRIAHADNRGLEREEAHEREEAKDLARWEEYQRTGEHISAHDMAAWLDALERNMGA